MPAKKEGSSLQNMFFSPLLLKQHNLPPELSAYSAGQQKQREKHESSRTEGKDQWTETRETEEYFLEQQSQEEER